MKSKCVNQSEPARGQEDQGHKRNEEIEEGEHGQKEGWAEVTKMKAK